MNPSGKIDQLIARITAAVEYNQSKAKKKAPARPPAKVKKAKKAR